MTTPRACRFCRCTDDRACVTDGIPCHWVAADICSACAITRNGITFLPIEPAAQDGRIYIVMDGDRYLYRATWHNGRWVYGDGAIPPLQLEQQPTHYHPRHD